jgi:hypothetical protein
MDPNAKLDQQLELAKRIIRIVDGAPDGGTGQMPVVNIEALISAAEELAERVEALDHWITGGGFLPERWHDSMMRTHDALDAGRPLPQPTTRKGE